MNGIMGRETKVLHIIFFFFFWSHREKNHPFLSGSQAELMPLEATQDSLGDWCTSLSGWCNSLKVTFPCASEVHRSTMHHVFSYSPSLIGMHTLCCVEFCNWQLDGITWPVYFASLMEQACRGPGGRSPPRWIRWPSQVNYPSPRPNHAGPKGIETHQKKC